MPIVVSRSRDRGTPSRSVPGGSSSMAISGTTSPVGRTTKYPGHGLVLPMLVLEIVGMYFGISFGERIWYKTNLRPKFG